MKVRARIILTEIPINIEMEVDPVFWVTSDENEQANAIWRNLEISHPLCTQVALINTKLYPKTSWIENIKVI